MVMHIFLSRLRSRGIVVGRANGAALLLLLAACAEPAKTAAPRVPDATTLDSTAIRVYAGPTGGYTMWPAGTAAPFAPSVTVRDANRQPLAGVRVDFLTTGGDVEHVTTMTNNDGVASAGVWTLAPTAQVNSLSARVVGRTATFAYLQGLADSVPTVAGRTFDLSTIDNMPLPVRTSPDGFSATRSIYVDEGRIQFSGSRFSVELLLEVGYDAGVYAAIGRIVQRGSRIELFIDQGAGMTAASTPDAVGLVSPAGRIELVPTSADWPGRAVVHTFRAR